MVGDHGQLFVAHVVVQGEAAFLDLLLHFLDEFGH